MSLSLKREKIFQEGKRHSSVFWKVFQICRNYFSCYIHFKFLKFSEILASTLPLSNFFTWLLIIIILGVFSLNIFYQAPDCELGLKTYNDLLSERICQKCDHLNFHGLKHKMASCSGSKGLEQVVSSNSPSFPQLCRSQLRCSARPVMRTHPSVDSISSIFWYIVTIKWLRYVESWNVAKSLVT